MNKYNQLERIHYDYTIIAPKVVLKGKDFANELTIYNSKEKQLKNNIDITQEHIDNNSTIRKAMIERGIVPEELKPEIDIKKIKKRLSKDRKKELV